MRQQRNRHGSRQYARRSARQGARSVIGFNLTPMVDVIFLLAIFFMLVSRFSSAEQVPMELPAPTDSQAKTARATERVIINCRLAPLSSGDSMHALYSIGPNQPEPLARLADRLKLMKAQRPGMQVVLRADRRLPYRDVRAAMRVVAENKIEILNVVAHLSEND